MTKITDDELFERLIYSNTMVNGVYIGGLAREALRARKAEVNLRLACRLALAWMWYQDLEVDPSWVQKMKEALEGGKEKP